MKIVHEKGDMHVLRNTMSSKMRESTLLKVLRGRKNVDLNQSAKKKSRLEN